MRFYNAGGENNSDKLFFVEASELKKNAFDTYITFLRNYFIFVDIVHNG